MDRDRQSAVAAAWMRGTHSTNRAIIVFNEAMKKVTGKDSQLISRKKKKT
jgi:hypothetical protein